MSQHDETMRMLGLIRESKNSNKGNKSLLREQTEINNETVVNLLLIVDGG